MSIDQFTGSESPADIVKAVIEEFSRHPHPSHPIIFYEDSIPKLKHEFQAGDIEFSCIYRLDTMLAAFYPEAERIFAEANASGFVEISLQEYLVPIIAFVGMNNMLNRLLILQAQIFLENFDEAGLTAAGIFLHSLMAHKKAPNEAQLSRAVSKLVQGWIDDACAASLKKKRDYLVGFMNTQQLLRIPTSAGRPPGTTKSKEKRAKEKTEFESRIEQILKPLFLTLGREPFKYEVAEALGIGGFGTDSRINSLNNKLTRLGVDYTAIIERCKPHQ